MVSFDYQCCYCDQGIAATDRGAIRIVIAGLWSGSEGAAQDVFAHAQCAAETFAGALSASIPFDIEAYAPDSGTLSNR